MAKKNKTPYFRGDIAFQKQMQHRARMALAQLQDDFAREHKTDTEEQLLQYVCAFAKELGRSPNAGEIIGGPYIAARFGGWEKVLLAAGMPTPGKMPELENRLIFKKELKRQTKLVKQEQQQQKEIKKEERRQKDARGRAAVEAQQTRDSIWGQAHAGDTDEQLISYVKSCARELGHSPMSKEVLGATYIAKRFGSWALVLMLADLPLPCGGKPPYP